MSAYWSQWDYSELMDWVGEVDDEVTDGDFEESFTEEDEYCMPLSLDSLGMSWRDFM